MALKLYSTNIGGGGSVTFPIQINQGGTGQTTATLAFDALSPLTTKGDIIGFDGTDAVRFAQGSSGQLLSYDPSTTTGLRAISQAASGVTSVGIVTDSTTSGIFANTANAITGSPVTSSGNMTLTYKTQTANTILAGPTTGAAAAPTFRAMVGADLCSFTGDVTNSGAAMTVAKIQGTTVSGTSGSTNVVFSASPTLTGTITAAAANFSGAVMISSTLKAGNYHLEPLEYDAGNSSTAQTIDWSNASSQKSTLTGNVTYTFSNPVAGGAYVLKINTGAGSFTATWPAAVKWSGGTSPTITTTASKIDLISFYYDGTNYLGTFSQNY